MGTIATCISSTRPAFRYCWIVAAPPPSLTSRPPAAAIACDSADSMPSVTKLKVVPPSIGIGSRGGWVSTNTGWWYGGGGGPPPLPLVCPPPPPTRPHKFWAPVAGPHTAPPPAKEVSRGASFPPPSP